MKFGKNLRRIVELSDPAWTPFWPNYRAMKKRIKDIANHERQAEAQESNDAPSINNSKSLNLKPETLQTSPEEVAFFKLMHAELKKVSQFFDEAEKEALIRSERLLEGHLYVSQQEVSLVPDKWSTSAKAVYNHYKDLLVLETYAIMSFCSFSKALKKHDKITGHNTRKAFMTKLVNKANFTSYPSLMKMIEDCQTLQEQVAQELQNHSLAQDEQLFLDMIEQLNGEAMTAAALEGASNLRGRSLRTCAAVDEPAGDAQPTPGEADFDLKSARQGKNT